MAGRARPADSVEAVVVHSDLRRTGTLRVLRPMLNQLHSNVVWGLKGNFLDVPTDCPQRDERLGWTGDLAVFAPTAAYLYDVDGLPARLAARPGAGAGAARGIVPFVVPDALKHVRHPPEFPDPDATAVWSDAAVWVPWALWQAYGDLGVLEGQYDSMAAHVRPCRVARSPPPASGTPASSSATGSTRRRHPTSPFRPRRTTASWRRRASTAPRPSWPRPHACTGRHEDAQRFDELADAGPGTRSASTTCATTAHPERRGHGLRAGDRVRAARRRRAPARRRPARTSWWPTTTTGSPPGSPGRRTSPTR